MPPLVTYSGVAESSDVKGNLFSGKKFFLTQRIPLRSRYVKDVETNGGTVVKLENQADYIIADHLRNDAPAGSISYTFIEKAIKDGKLPPEEDYVAARPRGTIRSAGSSAPVRSMRTAFTDADDKELYKFVKNAEAQGVAIKGQELYKELEAINPRHTWQSWRERWLKQFDVKPAQVSRVAYTEEDDRELYAWIQDAEQRGISATSSNIYKDLEKRNPRHPWQSWRERYIKKVAFDPPSMLPDTPTDIAAPPSSTAPARRTSAPKPSLTRPAAISTVSARRAATSTAPAKSNAPTRALTRPPGTAPRTAGAKPNGTTPARPSSTAVAVSNPPAQDSPLLAPVRVQSVEVVPQSSEQEVKHVKSRVSPIEEDQIHTMDTTEDVIPLPEPEVAEGQSAESSSMPGFEKEPINDWLAGAEHIQDIPVGGYHAAWLAFADANPEYTAVEWRNFYEQVVLPVYLAKAENLKLPRGVSSGRVLDFLKLCGTQGQPVHLSTSRLSGTTRHEAGPSTSGIPVLQGQTAAKAASETPKGPIQKPNSMPTAANGSTKRKVLESEDVSERVEKRLKVEETQVDIPAQLGPKIFANIKSSDHITISSEAPSEDEEDEEDATVININENIEESALTSDLDAMVQDQLREEIAKGQTVSLTAENLALAQAEHEPPADRRRALDIVPDDEEKDQGGFVSYLENLVGSATAGGQVSKNDSAALKAKHQQLEALAKEREDQDDDDHEGEVEDVSDDDSTIFVDKSGRKIDLKNIPNLVKTQDVDPSLDYSSPMHQASPEHAAPLDPDFSPQPSPYRGIKTQDIDPEILADEDSEGDIELDVAEPEGGWSSPLSFHGAIITYDALQETPQRDKGKGKARELYTQDIFDGPTQQPDFDMAEPESQFNTQFQDVGPTLDSQPMDGKAVEAFVATQKSRGLEDQIVMDALFWTSFHLDLCLLVLEAKVNKTKIPNMAGIWSEREDQWLEGGDAVKLRQLEEKHGEQEMATRRAFLLDFREGESQQD